MALNANALNKTQTRVEGAWVPARPEPGPWLWRLKDAWEVLQGRAEALFFPGQDQPKRRS